MSRPPDVRTSGLARRTLGLAGPLRPANLADWLGGGFTLRWCGKATAWKGKARSSNGRQLRVDEVIAELDTGRVVPG